MTAQTPTAHFELYALRRKRWLMDACFADEAEALDAASRLRLACDVQGVRVVREIDLPGASASVTTVLVDSTRSIDPLPSRDVALTTGDRAARVQPARTEGARTVTADAAVPRSTWLVFGAGLALAVACTAVAMVSLT
ncbi:MAG: hypothetical protein AAFX81_01100 [Pseudomonadota bacterium]